MDYDFNFITPRLATGASPANQEFMAALVTAGITHIVDVTDAQDDTSLLATHPNVAYLYNPTADDGTHKSVDWFSRSLAFSLPAFLLQRARVYTHCSAGINRGPSTAYAIMRAFGWTSVDALALLKQKRPQVGVAYAADADYAIKELGYE